MEPPTLDDPSFPPLIEVNQINSFWTFLQSVDWHDPWLVGLIFFHVIITLTSLLTRNHSNFQVILFFVLLLLVYFSESINTIAAKNWSIFSNQQYFDSKGMFISIVFSVPILLNCMILVANWLWASSQLMINLKRAQLRAKLSELGNSTQGEGSTPVHERPPGSTKKKD